MAEPAFLAVDPDNPQFPALYAKRLAEAIIANGDFPTPEVVQQQIETALGEITPDEVTAAMVESVGGKLFDRGDQSYNVTTSSLRHWRTALAGAEPMNNNTQRAARLLLGWNSIIFGAGLNAISPNIPAQLSAMFAREFPAAGSGIVHLGTPSQFQQDGGNNVDNRINRIGVWDALARGVFNAGALRATGTDKKLTFTDVGTEFVIYYAKAADGGTMTVQVDGGATATIDCSGTGTGSYTIVNTIATGTGGTALTDTSHVVTITAPTSGFALLTGFEARRGRSGVRVTRAAQSGATTSTLLVNEESMATVFDQAAPDLTVLLELINDWLNADLPVATFKARWATIIQRAKLTGDALIVVPPISNEDGTYPFSDYETALYQLADEYDCVLVNIRARWGTFAEANAAGLMGDPYHPSYKGYRDIARAIYEVIGTKAPGSTVSSAQLGVAQAWTARQTFNFGATIAAGQSLLFGETSITRDAAFSLSVNGLFKPQRLLAGSTTPASLGVVSARAAAGIRAISAQGSDGTERAGFDVDGRLFFAVAEVGTSAPTGASRYVPVRDANGTQYLIEAKLVS